jgi:hypothetical protein
MNWVKLTKNILPPTDVQVLICHTQGQGDYNYDVACYLGRNKDGSHRWLCTDVEIDHKNIHAWQSIEGFNENLPNYLLDKFEDIQVNISKALNEYRNIPHSDEELVDILFDCIRKIEVKSEETLLAHNRE